MLTSTLPYLSLKSVNVLLSFTCFLGSENASTSPLAHLFARGSQTSTSSFPYPSVGVNLSTATFLPVCMGWSENINIQFPLLLCRSQSINIHSFLPVCMGRSENINIQFPLPICRGSICQHPLSHKALMHYQALSFYR